MGKEKQQVISRFFAPKPKTTAAPPPNPPSPKISATVSFSPSKKRLLSLSPYSSSSSSKPPKLPKQEQASLRRNLLSEPAGPGPSPPSKYTPLEQQVIELKKSHPDVLLMVEVGYKYRFFGADAETAAAELGIYAHVDRHFLTASVPAFRLGVHLRRLVAAGHKVGVVRQTETAAVKARGPTRGTPFGRGLSALYTRATLAAAAAEEGDPGGGGGDYLACVAEREEEGGEGVRVGVVGVEISTGDVVYGEFEDDVLRNGLQAFLLALSPAEILLALPLSNLTHKLLLGYAGPASHVRVERTSRECFDSGGALAEVMTLYEDVDGNEQGNHHSAIEVIMEMPDLVVQALALTIRYLKQFGLEKVLCVGASFRPFSSNFEMTLSANALQQLEVLQNNSDGSESGALLQIMNHTITPFGSRLLRHWVTHPLCDRNMIIARLDAVSEIGEAMGSFQASQDTKDLDKENIVTVKPDIHHVLSSVLATLARAPDIQRGITRIFHRTASPTEFVAVIQAILDAGKHLQQLHTEEKEDEYKNGISRANTLRSELLRKLILTASSPSIIRNSAQLLSSLNKEAADQRDLKNLIICNGQFPEVATSRKNLQLTKEKLDSLISLYRKQLRMSKLEFTSVSGTTHLIELSLDVKVPSNWVKINSTKKTIRYHPPEVLAALNTLSLANEELNIVCQSAWNSFLGEFGKYYVEFQATVQALATLDCLYSLALLSRNKNYVRPVFVHDDEPVQIHITTGRHPVLEDMLQDNFVPNDTDLHSEREYCQIVTGPNMGGKSCYIRQVALIAIMAQVGSFVPASLAKLHVLDGIHTRMGASDSIQQGRSTFLEELSEASHILRNCTPRSLVIIDELGRGTSTHDGVAIAYATLHHLLDQKRSMVLFVTHYPKIADIRSEFPGSVEAYHVSYLTSRKTENTDAAKSEFDHDVTYLYKLVPGVSEKSFGFKVAELAQLPSPCVHRACIMAAKLEALVNNRAGNKSKRNFQLLETLAVDTKEEITMDTETLKGYEEFFSSLNAALSVDDLEKGFQLLNQAKGLAKELVYKQRN